MNQVKIRRLKRSIALGSFFILNTLALNNCSQGFKTADDPQALNQRESSSESNTPPASGSEPPPLPSPASPTPVPPAPVIPTSPANFPSWLKNQPLDSWIEIPNTQGAGGTMLDAWGGLTLRDDTSEIFILASGGHTDSYDNRVVSIRLMDDQPQWQLRSAPSPASAVVPDVPYCLDGKPGSRHIYQHNHWAPTVNRLMLIGLRGHYPTGGESPTIDAFNPDTNTWDPQGTWPNLPVGAGYGMVRDKTQNVIWTQGLKRFDPATKTFSSPIKNTNIWPRWPAAHDTKRNQIFHLQYGDGQGYDLNRGVVAARISLVENMQFTITFNPSPALTQFKTEQPFYSAMDYDPENDEFLFYYGYGTSAGRIYVVKPNASNVWDMSLFPLAAGSKMPGSAPNSGINGRFLYVPTLRGFVLLPSGGSNLWFIRTAN